MPDSIETLENEVSRNRKRVAAAVASLVGRVTPGRSGPGGGRAGPGASEASGHLALDHARRTPGAMALIGIGAVLLLAQSRSRGRDAPAADAARIAAADSRIKARARAAAARPMSSREMRAALDAGLDRLPPEARERVTNARLKAIDAQDAVERRARKLSVKVSEKARAAHAARPFATALLAAGLGGVLGAVLPSPRGEGARLDARRDALLRHAEALWRAEIAEHEARTGGAAVATGAAGARQRHAAGARA